MPRAATGSVPMISSPRTITTSSIMLTTTQTWLGTMRTTSPTFGPRVAAGQIEKTVLLGKARDLRFRVLQDQAVALEPAAGVRGQRLGAGVEDAAVGAGAADDGGIDVERAVVPGGDAGRDLHAVVVDVGAGPVLGRALELAEILQVGRAAG